MTSTAQIVALAVALFSCNSGSTPHPHGSLLTFTLEELVPMRQEFYPHRISVQWISDTEYIYNEPSIGIRKYNADLNSFITVLDVGELINLNNYSVISFSRDGKYILMASNRKKVYRYSTVAEYSIYNIQLKSIASLAQGPLEVVVWGNEHSLAYVQENNVYYVADVAFPDVVTTLTNEGVPGEVYFGASDWIYEEEVLNAAEAMWFSPSGDYLAVASFNDTEVESAVFSFYGDSSDLNNQYPQLIDFKYPKAGRANPIVGLRVFKVNDPKSDAWNIPAPVDIVGLDHILGRVNWASDQNLVVLWLNRRQSVSVLIGCNLEQDKCNIVRQQTEPNGWIDVNEPFFDSNGSAMVEIQPQYMGDQRFFHVISFDFTTFAILDRTPINSTVTSILGWNPELNGIYYIMSPEDMPWRRQLWVSTPTENKCISCEQPACNSVSAMFSPKASYAILTCSATNVPYKTYFYNGTINKPSNKFTLIKDNSRLSDRLSLYKMPLTLFNVISLGENLFAHVKLNLPPNMIQNQRYPMIVRVYGGPGSSRVSDSYDLEAYNLYLSTNRSFIVASIDVRGSGVMGVEAMHAVNNALGTVEVSDTLAAIRALVVLYNFIDPRRVGVWGWSYGGFLTTAMLIQDEEKIVACGAAVAPVTSWLYYDSIYTERYMDTPQLNPIGYQQSDLTTQTEKLRGRQFLLIHGTGDDNVHYQHSLQLAKKLQHADIDFEQVSYTDETHSLLSVSRHLYHTLDRFWTKCFNP